MSDVITFAELTSTLEKWREGRNDKILHYDCMYTDTDLLVGVMIYK